MIHHLSIAARDPQRAASVLAELMGGKAVPFPPNPGSFFALQLDEHGSGVEVYPAGTELAPNGEVGGSFVKRPEHRGYGSTHFALSVATDSDTVQAIAKPERADRVFFSATVRSRRKTPLRRGVTGAGVAALSGCHGDFVDRQWAEQSRRYRSTN